MRPQDTHTLEEFINSGSKSTINYRNLSFRNMLSNRTEVSVLNVVNDYIDELKAIAVTVSLNDLEYLKYRYKPKLLCQYLYGNPEVYYIILLLNNIADVKEFDFKSFRALRKDDMSIVLTEIYNAENQAITYYNNRQDNTI